jgi:hypothetical protein
MRKKQHVVTIELGGLFVQQLLGLVEIIAALRESGCVVNTHITGQLGMENGRNKHG